MPLTDILGTCWQRGPCQLALSGQGQMKSTGSPGSGGGRAKPFATCDMHGAWRADDDCEERRVVSNYHLSERLYSTCSFWSDALQSFVSTERPYKVNIISFPRGGNDDFQRLNISLKWHICLMVDGAGLFITSKIILLTTPPTCLSCQGVWNLAGLYSEICSSMKFQGNLIITLSSDRCAASGRWGIVHFTSVSCCWVKRRL